MWEYFWSDMAFDFVKGLVAGGASLALQAVAPSAVRAVKRLRAHWRARKSAQERKSTTPQPIDRRVWRWLKR